MQVVSVSPKMMHGHGIFSDTGVSGSYILSLGSTKSEGLYYLLGDEPVTLLFDTDGSVTYPGFRVYYYIGELSPGKLNPEPSTTSFLPQCFSALKNLRGLELR